MWTHSHAGYHGTGERRYLWINAGWIYVRLDLEGGFVLLGAVIGFWWFYGVDGGGTWVVAKVERAL